MSGHVLRLKSIKPLGEYRVAAVEYIKLFEDEKNFTTSWRVIFLPLIIYVWGKSQPKSPKELRIEQIEQELSQLKSNER